MSTQDPDHSFDENRFLALEMRSNLILMIKSNEDRSSDIERWIIASLLAVNGAGVIGCLNSIDISFIWRKIASVVFSAGLCFAILSGYACIWFARKMVPILSFQLGIWTTVAAGGQIDREREIKLAHQISNYQRRVWVADIFGVISFILFIFGSLLAGLNIEAPETEIHARQTVNTSESVVR